jgi:hypothetical protein
MLWREARLFLVSVTCFALLGACMGSGDASEPALEPALEPADALLKNSLELSAKIQQLPYSNLSEIQTFGSLSYEGFMLARLDDRSDNITDTLATEISISVDFDTSGVVTGESGRIFEASGEEMQGLIKFSGGTLDLSGDPALDATFEFIGKGEVIDRNGTVLSLDFLFEGDFFGSTNEGLAGGIFGQAEVNGDQQRIGGQVVLSRTE